MIDLIEAIIALIGITVASYNFGKTAGLKEAVKMFHEMEKENADEID